MRPDSTGSGGRPAFRLQGAFVGLQVALCTVLMIGTGLLLRGMFALHTVDPGFAYTDIAVVTYDLPKAGYAQEEATVFQQEVVGQVRALPGVEGVALVMTPPLGDEARTAVLPPGQDRAQSVVMNSVSSDYFSLLGIPVVQGRTFTADEIANDLDVVIVSESTARRFWPGLDPVGQRLTWGQPNEPVELQVVGVAKDAQIVRIGESDTNYIYLPAVSGTASNHPLLVKGGADFASIASRVRTVVARLDPGLTVVVIPLERNLAFWRSLSRLVTMLALSVGMLALFLAGIGIYGVVSYFVTDRFREIGIRMALGATRRNVLGLVVRQSMPPVLVGVALGVFVAIAASRLLASVLFGVSTVDPIGMGGAIAFMLAMALLATTLPGRRAVRSEPMTTLRHD